MPTSTIVTNDRSANIDLMIAALLASPIKGRSLHIGVLCCVAKECNFKPRTERGYGRTSNARIRTIFGSRVASLSDAALDTLKADTEAFFNLVYGKRLGNTAAGDGYKYRGRGFNQLTFKGSYRNYAKYTGIDILNDPDLLNTPDVAAKVCAVFMERTLLGARAKPLRHGLESVEDASCPTEGVALAVNANAGWGKDTRGGRAEKAALKFLDEMTKCYDDYVAKQEPGTRGVARGRRTPGVV